MKEIKEKKQNYQVRTTNDRGMSVGWLKAWMIFVISLPVLLLIVLRLFVGNWQLVNLFTAAEIGVYLGKLILSIIIALALFYINFSGAKKKESEMSRQQVVGRRVRKVTIGLTIIYILMTLSFLGRISKQVSNSEYMQDHSQADLNASATFDRG